MKLQSKRFTLEEFPEQQEWIGNLLQPLNQQNSDLINGLNNNLTIADNLNQEIKEVRFVNNAANLPIKFKTKFNKLPMGFSVIYCKDTLGGTASNTPWCNWSFSNGIISVSSITNLTTDKDYTIRFHIIYS